MPLVVLDQCFRDRTGALVEYDRGTRTAREPEFERTDHMSADKPILYLDNAATSFPKPEPVYQALDHFARTQLANPGRSSHRMAKEAERSIDNARAALNRFFNGESPDRWIFTLNCTDGLNIAIKGSVQPGDHVITSDLEHNSISRPLRQLEKDGTITLTRLASDGGYLDPGRGAAGPHAEDATRRHDARLERPGHGAADRARSPPSSGRPAPCFARRCGPVGGRRADRPASDADRPAGVPRPQGPLRPDRHGCALRRARDRSPASGARAAPAATPRTRSSPRSCRTPSKAARPTPWASPASPRACPGSPSGASRRTDATRSPSFRRSSTGSRPRAMPTAGRSPAAGTPPRMSGRLSLITPNLDEFHPQSLADILDTSFDIAVRPGLHCAPYIHRRLGTFPDGTLRLSPGPFNTVEEIDGFLGALTEITAGVL